MKKITSLFKRDFEGNRTLVLPEYNEGTEWVHGTGSDNVIAAVATRKRDGMAIKIENDRVYKRFDAKPGRGIPEGFIPCEPVPDPHTGHWPGWVPLPDFKAVNTMPGLVEAIADQVMHTNGNVVPGTYELCGPSIGTRAGVNPEGLITHRLYKHGSEVLRFVPTDYAGLKHWFATNIMEGIVWHNVAGDMVKIKRTDFGYGIITKTQNIWNKDIRL